MAANAAAAREFERGEENSEGSPIPTLESVLLTSCRADLKGGWPTLGHKSVMNPPKKFLIKIRDAYKMLSAKF
jgi:hypothetical protein